MYERTCSMHHHKCSSFLTRTPTLISNIAVSSLPPPTWTSEMCSFRFDGSLFFVAAEPLMFFFHSMCSHAKCPRRSSTALGELLVGDTPMTSFLLVGGRSSRGFGCPFKVLV